MRFPTGSDERTFVDPYEPSQRIGVSSDIVTPQSGPTGDTISIDWNGVRPMRRNPRTSDHAPGSSIRKAQEQFNNSYCTLLQLLEQTFNGSPQMLETAIGAMYRLRAQAQALMDMPIDDGTATAGPTFEDVAPHPTRSGTRTRSLAEFDRRGLDELGPQTESSIEQGVRRAGPLDDECGRSESLDPDNVSDIADEGAGHRG